MEQIALQHPMRWALVRHAKRRLRRRSTLTSAITGGLSGLAVLSLALAVEPRPPLQGGVERSERERQRAGYCARYAASVNPFEGTLQVMPKAGQGHRDLCVAPRSHWTLLGEDRNYCCFFAPRDWVGKIPPLPGSVLQDQPPRDRQPFPPSPACQKNPQSYTCLYGHADAGSDPGPAPGPTRPTAGCRDQVEVHRFVATPVSGLVPHIGMAPAAHRFAHLWLLSLYTGRTRASERLQGITFEAVARLKTGAIPVDEIHLRYIQNVTRWEGTIAVRPGPSLHASLRCGSLPILDLVGTATPPPPYYLGSHFREQPTNGIVRTVVVTDAPRLHEIVIRLPSGAEREGIDVEAAYTTYVGCIVGNDPQASTFETLATLDWRVRYKGRLLQSSGPQPYQFQPAPDAGIVAGPAVASAKTPIKGGATGSETFNHCQSFRE